MTVYKLLEEIEKYINKARYYLKLFEKFPELDFEDIERKYKAYCEYVEANKAFKELEKRFEELMRLVAETDLKLRIFSFDFGNYICSPVTERMREIWRVDNDSSIYNDRRYVVALKFINDVARFQNKVDPYDDEEKRKGK